MATATHDGVALSYDVAGPADGELVVFVEGLAYGRWMWKAQREALSTEYRTIRFDNRGTGDSDEPAGPYTISEMAGDLEAVLAAEGVTRAHVAGASMGGMIAQRYAVEYDRAATLSLLCTAPGGDEAIPIPDETQAAMFAVPEGADERETLKHRMAPAVSDSFYEDEPELVERIVDWRLETDAGEEARKAQAAAVLAFDASDELGGIDVPALVLHGTDDRVVPAGNADLLAAGLPDVRVERREGGHHLLFVEEADWVNERLHEFLAANPIDEASDA